MVKRVGVARLAVLAVVVLLLSAGCEGPYPAGTSLDGEADIYCLRGLWDFFSHGLNILTDRLRYDGFDAVAMSGPDWPVLADVIPDAQISASATRQLVLLGHSYGADEAILLSRTLRERGISVPLLILLDATDPPPIPDNVDRCVHFYIPTPLARWAPQIFAGNPVVPAAGNTHTVITNRVVTPDEFPMVDHFNIESAGTIHDAVIEEIRSYLRGGEAAAP